MRNISAFSLALLLLTACHPGGQGSDKIAPQPRTEAEINKDELQPMMEKKGVNVPVNLTPTEKDNLKRAVDTSLITKDSAAAHIHAEVQNGQLVFVPEPSQDVSHVTADAPKITLGGRNPRTFAVVATPEARQLLEQRAGQSH